MGARARKASAHDTASADARLWLDAPSARTDRSTYRVRIGTKSRLTCTPAKPGDYEVRLHANYPTKTTHVVHRVAIRVEGQ